MRNRWHDLLALLPLLVVILLARTLPVRYAGAMPQVPGDDILQLVLGDARRELGRQMLAKADSYYHGGMTHTDCTGLETHDSHADHDGQPGHLDDDGGAHGPHGHAAHAGPAGTGFPDPWQWIDRQVHAQPHRHLEREAFDELLPWLWAACRSAPADVQVRLTAAYVLERQTGEPRAAIRLLEEGLTVVPESPELAFALGELHLNKLKAAGEAERWFERARTNGASRAPAGDADAQLLEIRTLHYLAVLARRRNDAERLRALVGLAEAGYPAHHLTGAIRKLLAEPASR